MNRTFKVIFNQVLGRHVVVSEIASSIQHGAVKAIAVALMAGVISCLSLPANAKTYEEDSISESDFKSAVAVTHTTYSTGSNSSNGSVTLQIENESASGLKTVTVGINAAHAYLPGGKLVLVQESAYPNNENYNTFVNRFNALEHKDSERLAVITNQGKLSKTSAGSLSEDSGMNADGTEFTGTYTAEDGSIYTIFGKRGEKQPSGLYAWTTTITDQSGNTYTSNSVNYMSIENPPVVKFVNPFFPMFLDVPYLLNFFST